eukprot:3918747-Lingulodinium_polyedra.AAC.1
MPLPGRQRRTRRPPPGQQYEVHRDLDLADHTYRTEELAELIEDEEDDMPPAAWSDNRAGKHDLAQD